MSDKRFMKSGTKLITYNFHLYDPVNSNDARNIL
jgi:hypothetical protein